MYEAKKNALAVLTRIVKMQDDLNIKTRGEDWATQNLAWGRALWTEAAEAMGYLQWEWWKNVREPGPIEARKGSIQFRLELIDILHFGISIMLVAEKAKAAEGKPGLYGAQQIAEALLKRIETQSQEPMIGYNKESLCKQVEELAGEGLHNYFGVTAFVRAAFLAGMDHSQIAAYYLGKNVLNAFRQENGYKAGTYIKNWNGQEDNVALGLILEEYFGRFQNADHVMKSLQSGEFDAYVRKELHDTYVKVKGNE